MADLRTHLQALAAGQLPPARGHLIKPEDAAAVEPFASACSRLVRNSAHDGQRLDAPAQLLTLLP